MTIEEVLEHFGGRTGTSKALGVSYQAVRDWDEAGEVPIMRQWQIQAVTEGALMVATDTQAAAS